MEKTTVKNRVNIMATRFAGKTVEKILETLNRAIDEGERLVLDGAGFVLEGEDGEQIPCSIVELAQRIGEHCDRKPRAKQVNALYTVNDGPPMSYKAAKEFLLVEAGHDRARLEAIPMKSVPHFERLFTLAANVGCVVNKVGDGNATFTRVVEAPAEEPVVEEPVVEAPAVEEPVAKPRPLVKNAGMKGDGKAAKKPAKRTKK